VTQFLTLQRSWNAHMSPVCRWRNQEPAGISVCWQRRRK
jgi:hypothetical protein